MAKEYIDDLEDYEEDTQKDKYLTFKVDGESYGIGIGIVTEIIGIQPITEVPELPNYLKGIINLRGKIIPVMDIRMRFKRPAEAYSDRTCIIVIEVRDMAVGFIVDAVSDVLSIPEEDVVAPPGLQKSSNKYIEAIGKVANSIILLLDCDKILDEEDYSFIEAIGENSNKGE